MSTPLNQLDVDGSKVDARLIALTQLLASERVARLEAEAGRQEAVALYHAAQQTSASIDLETTLGNILDAVIGLTESCSAGIALIDENGTTVTYEAVRGEHAIATVGYSVPFGQGLTGSVAFSGEPISSADLWHDARWSSPVAAADGTLRSVLMVPVKTSEGIIGVLSAGSTNVGHYTPVHERQLRAFAEPSATAIVRARDLARRIKSDEQIRFQATILQHVRDSVIVTDLNRIVTYWNAGATTIFGYESEEMVGAPVDTLFAGPDPAVHVTNLRRAFGGDEYSTERQSRRKNGTLVWIDLKFAAIHDSSGATVGLLGIAKDIDERKRAEEALQRSEQYFRLLIERSSDVIIVLNADLSVRYASPSATMVSGYAPESMIGRSPLEAIHPDDHAEVFKAFEAIRENPGVSVATAWRGQHTDGSWRAIEATAINFLDEPAVNGLVFSLRDVTDRRHLEEQLRQSQKMDAIGQLAGGVAHDFNNLLTVILGFGEILLDEIGDQEGLRESLQMMLAAGESAVSLTRQLLAFSRRQVVTLQEVDLNAHVEQIMRMLRRLIGEDVSLTTRFAADLGMIRADSGQWDQVLMNLAANARDAMPTGGSLSISTGNAQLSASDLTNDPDAKPGSYVVVEMSDTGTGMDATTLARIFEPFFTTKGVGKGTGLGLAAVFGIVTQAGGFIHVESVVGQGTTFRIYWPRLDTAPTSKAVAAPRPRLLRGTETILLVEDDARVRVLARTILQSSGYTVLEADSGKQALSLQREFPGSIDLIVSDVVMPEMNGREAVEIIRRDRPGVKVLFMSGYTDDTVIRNGIVNLGASFFNKPFTPASLTQNVRKAIDADGPLP